VLSPDGRIVATLSNGGQPVLWNVANPRRPARIAIMPVGGAHPLWGEAFSPDGQILAVAYTDRIFLWDVASAARPRLLGTLAASVPQVYNGASFSPQDRHGDPQWQGQPDHPGPRRPHRGRWLAHQQRGIPMDAARHYENPRQAFAES
jgi:WD40 repeat protein